MNVLIIEFSVKNQRMSRWTAGVIASNSYGYLKFKFNFKTDDWKRTSVKMANFSYKGRNYPVLIDENNMCTVPKEVIHVPSFCVSVFGGGITTNKINIPVEDSGVISEEDTSTQYLNEIINQLTAQIDILNETKADDIVVDPQSRTVQLMANDTPIGDGCELPVGDGGSCDCEGGIYVPDVTDDNMLVFTLQDAPGEARLEFDIDNSNDWVDDDDQTDSNYVWVDDE